MKEKLQAIKAEALRQIESSEQLEKLNDIRVAFLGKKGELTEVLKSMKNFAPEERPQIGALVNETRAAIENILEKQDCGFALSDKFGDDKLIKNALLKKKALHSKTLSHV